MAPHSAPQSRATADCDSICVCAELKGLTSDPIEQPPAALLFDKLNHESEPRFSDPPKGK